MKLTYLNEFGNRMSVTPSNYNAKYESVNELAISFKRGEIITIGGRPTSGKTEILLKILENRNIKLKEKSLFISFNESPTFQFSTVQFLLNGKGVENTVMICDSTVSTYEQAIELIENAIVEHGIESVYLDDVYCFETFEIGELFEGSDWHFYYSPRMIKSNANFYGKLREIVNTHNINIIMTVPALRTIEERGGDKRPIISDLYVKELEFISTKILLVYRPEMYGFLMNEDGDSNLNKILVRVERDKRNPCNYEIDYSIK